MNNDSTRFDFLKWLALLLIAVVSIYLTFPLQEKLRFGLDLKGGTSFTMGVDMDQLRDMVIAERPEITNETGKVEAELQHRLAGADQRIIQTVRRRVDGMGMNEPVIQSMKNHRVLVQLPGATDETRKAARARLLSAAYLEFALVHPRNDQHVNALLEKTACPEGYRKSTRGRGYERVANFQEIADRPGYMSRLSSFGVPDPRYRLVLEKDKSGDYLPCFVTRKATLTGDSLVSASVGRDERSSIAVNFKFNAEGARIFGKVTDDYKPNTAKNPSPRGRQLAIIFDGQLVSAPEIKSRISDSGQITGNFDITEAQRLANDLNAGALPAPLRILAESSVSPTVGDDAKQAGIVAASLGFALVALFMFIYYWYSGLVANVALFLDVALLPFALVLCANVLGVFGMSEGSGGFSRDLPVLTMPGIAGLVLSLGMAVDANVLIFERIREEFQNKASVGTALQNGYGRAFTAIFDSNLTTIITGCVLFVVGTGPVRGYAIMLTAGVVISMFTAVVVTRLLFNKFTNPESVKPFRMLHVFSKIPNVDFVKLGKITTIASFAVILVTVGLFAYRALTKPASVLAVDLTGGTSIVYSFDQAHRPAVADVRKALDSFDNATVIQFQEGVAGVTDSTLLVKTGFTSENAPLAADGKTRVDVKDEVTARMQKAAPDAKFAVKESEEVGSMVGDDLKKSGAKAVLFSLVAILIYVGFRFEFGFGLGGIVALAHDALITLGLFSLCGRQVSLIVVTALLTIIGYSINDTIVVFDRIREDLRHDAKTSFADLCNHAINSTLSRTVITSVTTLFAVVALFAFGDGSIFDFALTMFIGCIAGTYSSMFIATPVMMWCYRNRRPQFDSEAAAGK